MLRRVFIVLFTLLALPVAAQAAVSAYPSSTTIVPAGPIAGGSASVTLNVARGEFEGAWLVASGGKSVAAVIDRGTLPEAVKAEVDWGHYVSFGGKMVPDALQPWDGKPLSPE